MESSFEVHDISTVKMPMQGQALMVHEIRNVDNTFNVSSSVKLK